MSRTKESLQRLHECHELLEEFFNICDGMHPAEILPAAAGLIAKVIADTNDDPGRDEEAVELLATQVGKMIAAAREDQARNAKSALNS